MILLKGSKETIAITRSKSWLKKCLQKALFICQKKEMGIQSF